LPRRTIITNATPREDLNVASATPILRHTSATDTLAREAATGIDIKTVTADAGYAYAKVYGVR